MKKGLIAAGLLVSLSGTAQDVSTYTPGTMGEGVVYYLPKTEIELQVTATKVVYTPGEFCQYADRYLRLTGISSQPEEHWEINSIKVNSIGIPDPDNAYAVKLKDKSAASQVELTPEGIIKAINTTFLIELFWSKERIMEVYLNSIEMGKGIYGAQAAAKYKFNTTAAKLSSGQCALIAATLPNPIRFNSAKPSAYLLKRQKQILRLMNLVPKFPPVEKKAVDKKDTRKKKKK